MPEHNPSEMIRMYTEQLNSQEKLVLEIAIEHLSSSFDITKSIGYINWLKKHHE